MGEEKEYSFLSIIGLILYIIFEVAVSAFTLGGVSMAMSFLMEHSTSILDVVKIFGFTSDSGLWLWIISICDHLMRIFILSVNFSFALSFGANALCQIANERTYIVSFSVYTLLMLCWAVVLCFMSNLFPVTLIPKVDIIVSLCLTCIFSLFFFMRQGTPSMKENWKSNWGVLVAGICCLIILLINWVFVVYFNFFSQFLDIGNWIDLFWGSDSLYLHWALQVWSHLQNILFICIWLGFGIFLCCKAIDIWIPAETTANFYQSSVILLCVEIFLYAITDVRSMREALIDERDFVVVIPILLFVSVLALFGKLRVLYND